MVTSEFHEEGIGGTGAYVFQLSKELLRRGHRVDIITSLGRRTSLNTRNFSIYGLKRSKLPVIGTLKWDIEAIAYSLELMRKTRYDVVHVHLFSAPYFPCIYPLRAPLITTIHRESVLTDNTLSPFRKAWYLPIAFIAIMRSKRVIVQNESFKKSLLPWVSRDKVCVVPNGVNCDDFVGKTMKKRLRKRLRIPIDAVVFLTLGRIEKCKGTEVLLQAIRIIAERGEQIAWTIVAGEGPFRSQLMARYRDLVRVVFTGFVSGRDKRLAYRESDVFVLPSIGGEGMPTVILEAMSAGLPVIASRIPGTVDLVDSNSVILVEPNDPGDLARAIKEMTVDSRARRSKALAAARTARRFDWKIVAERILHVYASCVS